MISVCSVPSRYMNQCWLVNWNLGIKHHWQCLSGTFCRVCVQDNVNSISYLLCSIWGCVYSAYPFILMVVRMRVLYLIIIIIEPICHCLGFGHETMVCDVCLSLFLLKYISGYHTHNYWQTATEWQQQHSQCHNKSTSRMDNGMITMNNEAIN